MEEWHDRPLWYILLADGTPVPCHEPVVWDNWFATSSEERVVGRNELPGGVLVSTIFLGIDMSFGSGPPVFYETLISGHPYDDVMLRYHTREQALAGHARWVAEVRQARTAARN